MNMAALGSDTIGAVHSFLAERAMKKQAFGIFAHQIAFARNIREDVVKVVLDGLVKEGAARKSRWGRDHKYDLIDVKRFLPPPTEEEARRAAIEAYERRVHGGTTYPELLTEIAYTEALYG